MTQRFSNLPSGVVIAPSILSADLANLEAECRTVLSATGASVGDPGLADLLHLDVMDGHFVPNLTMGPDLCRGLRRAFPEGCLDVHLMVTDPAAYIEPFAAAGADLLTFHLEAPRLAEGGRDPAEAARELAEQIRARGCAAGLAINPPTSATAALRPVGGRPLGEWFDLVLVMSVHPGFAGQAFIPEVLPKLRTLRAALPGTVRLQVDGGVNPQTVARAREAGADVLVAASAVFNRPGVERCSVIAELRGPVPASAD